MASFGKDLVAQLANPSFGKGLFEASKSLGGLPGQIRRKKELEQINTLPAEEKLTTLINRAKDFGLSDTQVATAQQRLKQLQARQANSTAISIMREIPNATNVEQLNQLLSDAYDLSSNTGLDTSSIVKSIGEASNKLRMQNTFKAMGQEYLEQYNMGVPPKDILEARKEASVLEAKKRLGAVLKLDDDILNTMSTAQILERVDNQKTQGGVRDYTEFLKGNRSTITEDNYSTAVDLAVKAYGVEGISKVNDLYSKSIERQEKAKNNRIVEAQVVLDDGAGLVVPGLMGGTKMKTVKVGLTQDGKLTPESEAYLSSIASSAYIPKINYNWSPDSKKETLNPPLRATDIDPNDPPVSALLR